MTAILQVVGYFATVYGLAWILRRRDRNHAPEAPDFTIEDGWITDHRDPVASFLRPLP